MTTAGPTIVRTIPSGPARVWVGSGWAAYLGPSLHLDHHRGAVTCVGIGIDDALTVEVDGREPLTARTVLVPAGVRHRLSTRSDRVAFVYLEPRGALHRRGVARMARSNVDGHPVGADHVAEPGLIACADAGDGVALHRLVADADAERLVDRRISWTLQTLHRPGGADVPTSELAAGCGVSAEHFLRLFAQETGVGLRGYRRWARMRTVAEVVAGGGDLTRAAADAGFATPSHLSLSFRRMFGLAPSRLLGPPVRLEVQPNTATSSNTAATVSITK